MVTAGQSTSTAVGASGGTVGPPYEKRLRKKFEPPPLAEPGPGAKVRHAASGTTQNPDPTFVMISSPAALRQTVEARPEAVQGDGDADPLLRGLEDDEGGALPLLHLVDEGVLHDDLGDAAGSQAAHEAGAANIGLVDLEAEAGRQEHPERGDHPEQPALAVRRLEHDYQQGDVGPVLGGDALHDGALLV